MRGGGRRGVGGLTSLLVSLFVTQDFKYSNVKTVKEQTFHKHSTNVPTSNRNETNTSELVPESAPSLSIWSRRADSGPNGNNPFSRRQIRERYLFWYRFYLNDILYRLLSSDVQYQNVFVSFPKRYQNVCPFVFNIAIQIQPLWGSG